MAGLVPPGTTLLGNEATSEAAKKINEVHKKADYLNLPCPIPYEELHREALMSLKPEYFEGMRFDFTKGLNQKFSLSHSVMMGPMEIPSQSSEAIKIPTAHYEFGANFIDQKTMLIGRVLTDGRVNARVKCDLTDDLALKANAQLTNEPHMSHVMLNFDYKGKDYRSQLQLGNGALFGASYIQSVTPHMSLGAEVFWAGQHRKSGVGYAGRYETDKMVAAGQVASTGLIALSYVQKVSEKVSLATDFMYNYLSKDVTASVGYDYALRQARLRGKIDSNGCTSTFLEERLNMGLNFVLSAEVEVLSLIRHPNMVLLLGACPEYGILVYEYMAKGSLEDRLFKRGNTPALSWQIRFRIAAEIATGLLFLHQTKPEPLVHRDLKPGNILLDNNYISKISDVGLARLVPTTSENVTQYHMTSAAETFCYIDPEYQQTGMLGVKSDVYSLGILLLQVITAKPPMGLTHIVEQAIENETLKEIVDSDVPDWPIEETLCFAKLALQCAELRRKDRPDLGTEVLPELNRLRDFAEEKMIHFFFAKGFGPSPNHSLASITPPISQISVSPTNLSQNSATPTNLSQVSITQEVMSNTIVGNQGSPKSQSST